MIMRLSFYIATFLLVEQFTHSIGFSILPTTTSATSSRATTTSLSLSAVPEAPPTEKRTKPLSPQELVAKFGKDGEEAPKLFEESLYDDMRSVLLTLEKRVQEGPGSLSMMEVEEFKAGTDRILVEMKYNETARLSGTATAPAAPPAEPAQTTSTPVQPTPAVQTASAPVVPATVQTAPEIPAPEAASVQEAPAQESPVETPSPPAEFGGYRSEELGTAALEIAASQMNAKKVSELLEAGLEMDVATADAAFWAVVNAVDRAEEADQPLPAEVPRMLHHIFDADLKNLLSREQVRTNVTCKQPADEGVEGDARKMNYIFDDSAHKDLPLTEGRRCEDGTCCDACSRNIFPTFASEAEISLQTFPELASLTFNELKRVSNGTILQFTRLIERVRRTIAHEYGLPLKSILPLQAYSRKYVAGTTQQGGGGGEGDFVTLHTDEATHDGYHYSCVLYLSTHGEDFEGGAFVFNDPAPEGDNSEEEQNESLSIEEAIRRSGRKLTPYNPTRGAAVIFSSGWENMHEVEKITSGTRYAVPCFFTTCPVPEAAYDQMAVGKPKTDEDIADDWLHLLLAHQTETPQVAMGRVKELLMKWHYMCAPLSEH